jgi:hypothetical protein
VIEYLLLLSKCKALSSKPSTAKKKKRNWFTRGRGPLRRGDKRSWGRGMIKVYIMYTYENVMTKPIKNIPK